ncbi:MAG: DUF3667 domain-containing protein [Bacteroidota bacterium]
MKKKTTTKPEQCFNCGTAIKGNFCHSCGQRVRDNLDRSLGRLLGEFFGNVFFFDNRFFLSLWYTIRYPGRMTVEFLDGKRKKFISPVTLFLFFNLIFFFVNPLTDYSLSLADQMYSQPYSPLITDMVVDKIKKEKLDDKAYSATYQRTSDDISKSIMILNIPIIALFVYLMGFTRRRFYFDSLIFTFHYFSIFILSWVMQKWVDTSLEFFFGLGESLLALILFAIFTLGIPLLYAILSIKKFLDVRWYVAIFAGIGTVLAVAITNLFYRLIVFLITFWST